MSNTISINLYTDGDHTGISRSINTTDVLGGIMEAVADLVTAERLDADERWVEAADAWEFAAREPDEGETQVEDVAPAEEPEEVPAPSRRFRSGDIVRVTARIADSGQVYDKVGIVTPESSFEPFVRCYFPTGDIPNGIWNVHADALTLEHRPDYH